jgi:diguanylate cyclase (GGDEF)-like protein
VAVPPPTAVAQDIAIEHLPEAAVAMGKRQSVWEHNARLVLSSVINHNPLPATMQLVADAFVDLYPSKAMAIFLRRGDQYDLEAEAGLPQRPATAPIAAVQVELENLARSNPALRQILASGAQLCLARPLVSSSGETQGAMTIFDQHQALLDETTCETVITLCDFARMAIEHTQLYEQAIGNSHYDPLTGLPNRTLLEERLHQALATATARGTMVAVCVLDLDRFRQINDTWGHEVGDACFRAVSERLQGALREGDTLGRQSSDEFVIVIRDLDQVSSAHHVCERLLALLAAPLVLADRRLTVTAGIGVSIFPAHGRTPEELLGNAHIAVQKSKQPDQARVLIYSPSLGRESRRAVEMADALVSAAAQRQFELAYQPIYNRHREIIAVEALLRWRHPKWGQISPSEFIPIAEQTGLIASIGDWVISEVCRQAIEWNAADVPRVKLFVNVSGVQLEFSNFSSRIAETLQRSGLEPHRLQLEITESWIISDLRGAAAKLQLLRNLGVGIAIDDFGTGHATFSYLQALPLDTLKIDRSFVRELQKSAVNLSTVRAIVGLAQQLGLKTVAEGVENEADFSCLQELGCDMVQGFLFSRPLKPKSACMLLKQQQYQTA